MANKDNIFVTGATGFIGRHLIASLLKERGVNFDGDIRTEGYGRLITVTDPDGNQFDLFEPSDE